MDNVLVVIIGILVHFCIFSVKSKDLLCNEKLIRSLPDAHLTASSSRGDPIVQTSPSRVRLNTTDFVLKNGTILMGGWSPSSDIKGHYIEATFDHMTMINELLTQGRHQGNGHLTMYTVNYTEDGTTWHTINNNIGVEQIFQGNSDPDTIQTNTLDCPIFAKGIRIIPVAWEKHVALRFDVTGCYVDTATSTSAMVTAVNSTAVSTAPTPNGSSTTQTIVTIGLSSSTTPIQTTQTTKPPTIQTTTTHKTKKISTQTIKPTTKPPLVSTTPRKSTATLKTAPSIKPTTPYVFLPGIINPFGTTMKTTVLTTKATTMTTKGFRPGIPDPFGPGQLIG